MWEFFQMDNVGPFPGQRGGYLNATVAYAAVTGTGFVIRRNTLTGSDSADIIAELDDLARQSSGGIKYVRTDLGSDFTSKIFKTMCSSRGITPQNTVRDGHEGIGRAEKNIRTLQERALAQLDHAQLTKEPTENGC